MILAADYEVSMLSRLFGAAVMKAALKKIIRRTARMPMVGRIYDVFGYIHRYSGAIYAISRYQESASRNQETMAILERLHLSSLTVKNGPFRGMQYPGIKSFSSAFLPKLLGSYEKELHGVIAGLRHDYSTIVDIGCAEGYYAVGLALKFPSAQVYAFDTDPEARTECQEMARINGVAERVLVYGRCDTLALKALDLGSRSLIMSDCEGYERFLFDRAMAEELRDHDLIIETHDWNDIETSNAVKSAFSSTHIITSCYSIDDIQKAFLYEYSELTALSLSQRRNVLTEWRPCVMEWVIARSRNA